jgi:hypothetical protein
MTTQRVDHGQSADFKPASCVEWPGAARKRPQPRAVLLRDDRNAQRQNGGVKPPLRLGFALSRKPRGDKEQKKGKSCVGRPEVSQEKGIR